MGSKRPHDEVEGEGGPTTTTAAAPEAKKRKGFRVGPANLPDGPWRRKNTKIKHELIHKAKLKKDYAKVKAELAREKEKEAQQGSSSSRPAWDAATATTGEPLFHPDRQLQMDDHHDDDDDRQHVNPERQAFLDGIVETAAPPPRSRQARAPDEPTPAENRQDGGAQQGEQGEGGPTTTTPSQSEEAPLHRGPRQRRENRKRRPDYYDKALEEGSLKKAEAEARAAEAERREKERARSIDERERTRRAILKAKGFSASGKPRGKPKLGRESKVLLDKVKRMVGA
ncbi:hypothetical protein DHEL01_v204417 [Diaporthe helianthi]|uniref:rRNA-processing protein FYV7 n=1 Tax=Diaporthe helianthi TaxID=158607 RepID=A0A2P5I3W3_DIAHE|nr:hypothetical protein DHEL01_v204417 [Diaporthe helianthi]